MAAPLLAGFSFTLLVLLLPTLGDRTTEVRIGPRARVVTDSEAFSAAPELAAILLLCAGLLLVASVQAAITARYHGHTPGELADWYPEYFPETQDEQAVPDSATLPGWDSSEWPAVRVGTRWYGGWPRRYLSEEIATANKWASVTRTLYHLGILSLLFGLAALVLPPEGEGGLARWCLAGVAAAGVLGELAWIVWTSRERLSKLLERADD